MITIISATNRIGAYTRLVSEIYLEILEGLGANCRILDLRDLPNDFIFTAAFEQTGENEAFNVIQEIVDRTDKFVFIMPEYNVSYPGVLKAMIDSLAYPVSFSGKVGGIVALSSGNLGGALAISHFTDVLNYLGMFVLPVKPRLANIQKNMADGAFTNKFYKELLEMQAKQLVEFQNHL